MTIPDVFDKSFFKKVLSSKCDGLVINNFVIEMGSNLGDNYCSEIYRANVSYTTNILRNQKISFIVKSIQDSPNRGPVLEDMQSHEKECAMYLTIIPKLSGLLNDELFAAKCYYSVTDPWKIIVFEDLKVSGFTMADRKLLLDMNHCKLTMKKLGRFHAASMIQADKFPNTFEKFNFGIINSGEKANEMMFGMIKNGIADIITVAENWGKEYENVVENLIKNKENFITKIMKSASSEYDTLKVLNHGDLWVNNMMFKYNEETKKPTDVIFVDYQLSYYSSPGLDLNYFLNTSPTCEVRENYRDEIILTYYKSLIKALKESDFKKIPTIGDILKEIERKEFYGLFASLAILPLILMEKQPENGGLEGLADEENSRKMRDIMFYGKTYQQAMKFILKRFNRIGVLNF